MAARAAALLLCGTLPARGAHQPIVDVLATTANTNATFRSGLEAVISTYRNFTLDDMYAFFDGFIFSFPSPEDPYGYLGPIYPVFIANPAGASLASTEPLAGWIEKLFTARAQYLNSADSVRGVAPYTESSVINMSDFATPPGGFASFQDFFGRRLAAGVRPISHPDDDMAVVSPADCQLTAVFRNTDLRAPFHLKGMPLDVGTLLGHDPIARRFEGGTSMLVHLNLTFYHRYHAPVAGNVTHMQMLGGIYLDKPYGPGWFYPYHRGVVVFDNPTAGLVAMVPVGMFDVGSVILDTRVGDAWRKGEEVGHFAFGGSAIVLLFGPDVDVTVIPAVQDVVKMGAPLVTLAQK